MPVRVARFSVLIKPAVQKELDNPDDALFARIDRKILCLTDQPRPAGCKKLKGHPDLWRIRIGDYRVVYAVNDALRTVEILRVAHRREVYER